MGVHSVAAVHARGAERVVGVTKRARSAHTQAALTGSHPSPSGRVDANSQKREDTLQTSFCSRCPLSFVPSVAACGSQHVIHHPHLTRVCAVHAERERHDPNETSDDQSAPSLRRFRPNRTCVDCWRGLLVAFRVSLSGQALPHAAGTHAVACT